MKGGCESLHSGSEPLGLKVFLPFHLQHIEAHNVYECHSLSESLIMQLIFICKSGVFVQVSPEHVVENMYEYVNITRLNSMINVFLRIFSSRFLSGWKLRDCGIYQLLIKQNNRCTDIYSE